MSERLRTKWVVFSNGERYPFLLDPRGIPCFYPTLFATTQLRNASKAPNTIAASLSAIRLLLIWRQAEGIDLEARFAQRDFLAQHEIESLCRHLQAKAGHSKAVSISGAKRGTEASRAPSQTPIRRVEAETQYIRMT